MEGNSPVWARTDFDDSSWSTIDLTPQTDPFDLTLSPGSFVPGWTAKGFSNLDGYAWYRLRVRPANPGQSLSLKMPADFEDAYQVYANGQLARQFGSFDSSPPTIFVSRPEAFTLPPPGPDGEIELALRFYMSPVSTLGTSGAGGMHEPPILGLPLTLNVIASNQNTGLAFGRFGQLLTTLLFLLLAPGAFWAWLQNRRELAFLWLFIELVTGVLFFVVGWIALASWLPADSARFWCFGVLDSIWIPGWIMIWWYWFGLNEKRWIPWAAWLLAAADLVVEALALAPVRDINFLSSDLRHSFNDVSLFLVAAICVLLLIVLVEGYRRDRTEGLLAAAPILLLEIGALFNYFSPLFNVPYPSLHIFALSISIANIASILLVLVVAVLAVRRFLRNRLREELASQVIEQDLEQARELQQHVLIPEEISSPDFNVQVEYHPDQLVGGDFFQTIAGRDGNLLVIIGDVSGKGISAAMLVSVLVGAARTRANDSFDPASMLAVLNKQLIGRAGGHFATCLVAELQADGRLRMANAGHIAPYLNGAEVPFTGSLPLGLSGKIEPSLQALQLRPGDQITFITDGVVEARDAAGELFGFARARIICNEPVSEIVRRAQQFGQNDDITVLRVDYTAGRRQMFAMEKS
ncbi:membrane hypothetical protein [Candidatus Sulfotelmatomonas gaucii]|uniref:PPM-type phosphatase domain-containing protein n=1 Tax=Candidatus Sulfuritelmatomonas gaucii TaxID=2043161 RepID=A0A2N9LTT0_9BACT|nr:membrane hypothetical protein [Candidatus Sulfotelmatomonas gaucii]